MSEENNKANDYAVARALNERVWKILWYVPELYPFYDKDLDKINRNYIFLVQELIEIYARNEELRDIGPKPVWHRYKHIEGYEPQIAELQDDRTGDTGQNHTAAVKRLCIIAGDETPHLNKRQKDLVAEADIIIATLVGEADKSRVRASAPKQLERDWYIPKYTFSITKTGVLLVNGLPDILKVNKTQAGSANTKLLEEAFEHTDGKPYRPTAAITRTLSTALSELGFSGVLRKLFFPPIHDKMQNELVFRCEITLEQAKAEGINTYELDLRLKQAGAAYEQIAPHSL